MAMPPCGIAFADLNEAAAIHSGNYSIVKEVSMRRRPLLQGGMLAYTHWLALMAWKDVCIVLRILAGGITSAFGHQVLMYEFSGV